MEHKNEISAGGIVFRKGENAQVVWLVAQHSKHHGWGFPKGLVGDTNPEEKSVEAAVREVREEGGIVARIINESPIITTYTYQSSGAQVHKKVDYYLMEYVSGNIQDHDDEVSDLSFIDAKEVMQKLTYEEDKQAFTQILHLFEAYNQK